MAIGRKWPIEVSTLRKNLRSWYPFGTQEWTSNPYTPYVTCPPLRPKIDQLQWFFIFFHPLRQKTNFGVFFTKKNIFTFLSWKGGRDSWNRCHAFGSILENSAPLLPLQELRRWREFADLSRNRKGSVVMSSIFQFDLIFLKKERLNVWCANQCDVKVASWQMGNFELHFNMREGEGCDFVIFRLASYPR